MGDHNDDVGVLLPDQPPEGGEGRLGGALEMRFCTNATESGHSLSLYLSGDISPGLSESVDVVGVEVFVLLRLAATASATA